MKAETFATAVLSTFSAVFLGAACFYYGSAQKAKTALESLTKECAALDSEIYHARQRITATRRDNAELKAALPTELQHPTSKSVVRITPGLDSNNLTAMMESNPKLFALAMKVYRTNIAEGYRPMFRALNLTPSQIDKAETLATQDREATVDIMYTAKQQGLPLNDPAVSTLMQQENDQSRNTTQAILGDAGYQQMLEFDRSLPAMGIVNLLAVTVALTSDPLTSPQADQLLQILANASSSYQSGGAADPATINWPAALGQAQGILTPTQFGALQGQYLQNQLAQLVNHFRNQEGAVK